MVMQAQSTSEVEWMHRRAEKFYGARHHKQEVYKVYKNLMVPGTINSR